MVALVIAEHDNRSVKAATFHTVTAALAAAGAVDVLIAGGDPAGAACAAAQIVGVRKVLVADAPYFAHGLAEAIAEQAVQLASSYTHLLFPATAYGRNIAPRVAARLDVAQVSDIIAVVSPNVFARPIYAGNAIATVEATDAIKVLTVRATAFDAAPSTGGNAATENVSVVPDFGKSWFVSREIAKSDRPELTAAKIIVAGGRGVGSAENYHKMLEPLADRLGAALCASRAAVDAGYVPNDYQVGQTGKIVAPELYIAVGISGAIQHLAGMKDSKVIVAINKDPEAPIFGVADYGVVGDLNELVPELVRALT